MEQPEALDGLLQGWRKFSNTSVLLFTGYEFSCVAHWFELHPGLVDAVVAGPFRQEAGQTLALRGSDNQTLHFLSELGAVIANYDRPLTSTDKRLDVMFDESGDAWFAGIPSLNMMSHLRHDLREKGHHAVTSDQKAITE
jgi:anaerobic ribonucleoside-triphosphate reductase activating protein